MSEHQTNTPQDSDPFEMYGIDRRTAVMGLREAAELAWASVKGMFSDEDWIEGVGMGRRAVWTGKVVGQLARSQLRCRRGYHNWTPESMVGGTLETVYCMDCEISLTPEEWFELG